MTEDLKQGVNDTTDAPVVPQEPAIQAQPTPVAQTGDPSKDVNLDASRTVPLPALQERHSRSAAL